MKLKHILKHIPTSSCLNCGSLWTFKAQLCAGCLDCLSKEQSESLLQTQYEFGRVYSLYEWSPGQSDMLSRLILWLKGPYQRPAWGFYAELFLQKRLTLPMAEKRIWVVIPPHLSQRKHALFWGESLAQQLGAKLIAPLRVAEGEKTGQKQKDRTLEQRARRRFILSEEFTLNPQAQREDLWVFADDVLTSGSTANAVHLALGSPPHFEVWCLGQRAALLRSLTGSVIKAE